MLLNALHSGGRAALLQRRKTQAIETKGESKERESKSTNWKEKVREKDSVTARWRGVLATQHLRVREERREEGDGAAGGPLLYLWPSRSALTSPGMTASHWKGVKLTTGVSRGLQPHFITGETHYSGFLCQWAFLEIIFSENLVNTTRKRKKKWWKTKMILRSINFFSIFS